MIAKLKGRIDTIGKDFVILDVNGVGYQVFASARTLSQLGLAGEATTLWIDTHVREDHIHLFGFRDEAEQAWFRLLYSVQGVGPKAAMAILGVAAPEQLAIAIAAGDKAVVTRADGVGPKLALRILTELKDKVADIGSFQVQATPGIISTAAPVVSGVDHDAVSALVNLGYSRSDAYAAVARVMSKANDNDQPHTLDSVIRQALKDLSA